LTFAWQKLKGFFFQEAALLIFHSEFWQKISFSSDIFEIFQKSQN